MPLTGTRPNRPPTDRTYRLMVNTPPEISQWLWAAANSHNISLSGAALKVLVWAKEQGFGEEE